MHKKKPYDCGKCKILKTELRIIKLEKQQKKIRYDLYWAQMSEKKNEEANILGLKIFYNHAKIKKLKTQLKDYKYEQKNKS